MRTPRLQRDTRRPAPTAGPAAGACGAVHRARVVDGCLWCSLCNNRWRCRRDGERDATHGAARRSQVAVPSGAARHGALCRAVKLRSRMWPARFRNAISTAHDAVHMCFRRYARSQHRKYDLLCQAPRKIRCGGAGRPQDRRFVTVCMVIMMRTREKLSHIRDAGLAGAGLAGI